MNIKITVTIGGTAQVVSLSNVEAVKIEEVKTP